MIQFRKISSNELKLMTRQLKEAFNLRDLKSLWGNSDLIVSEGQWIEIFLVPAQLSKVFQQINTYRKPYFIGSHIGEISKRQFKISLEGITLISEHVGKKTVLNNKGEKIVLYGRDLSKDEVLQIPRNIQRNDLSILINEHREALALGKYLVDGDRINTVSKTQKIIKNVIDKGWYLRKGR
ncbi:MAG: hypothetical protein ACTSQQ_00950 [Candidatus Helarchaeota archaeon]